MQPNYISISEVFSQDRRFIVPLFQRPYVWNREEQWEPLWDDVLGVLDRLIARKGEAVVASHFLGTIVLEQKPTATGHLERREVIDGQQRLTTLQILLKAVEHAIESNLPMMSDEERPAGDLAKRQVRKLTINDASGDEVYKVWPTNEDRSAFVAVMARDSVANLTSEAGRMSEAYAYFLGEAKSFLETGNPIELTRVLSEAVRIYMRLIVLDLDQGDEPQAIFETLNAHGTPLLPADLIKNWLLWEATRQGEKPETLYEQNWRAFDRNHDFWRAKVGTGHAARARIDTFLQNWIVKETEEPVPPKHLYDRFLRYAKALQTTDAAQPRVSDLMRAIHDDSILFERIDRPTGGRRFDLFLERLRRLDIVVFHPLLLKIMSLTRNDPATADACGELLESYLVRRLVCGAQTRSYGSLALTILKEVRSKGDVPVDEVLRNVLSSLTGSDEWPSDAAFRRNWMERQFYGYFKRDRVLMILQAIEHRYQTSGGKSEPLMSFDWAKLQIEHVMPQSWEAHWPLPESETIEGRKAAVQGIGNLTLVSKNLNPSLSNGPWIDPTGEGRSKRDGLHAHSMLMMNRRLLDGSPDGWSEDAISARADSLFLDAIKIWPRVAVDSA